MTEHEIINKMDEEIEKLRDTLRVAYEVIVAIYESSDGAHTVRQLARVLEQMRTAVPGIEE